jgi:transcriptional regulator with XRE-family HTH domain
LKLYNKIILPLEGDSELDVQRLRSLREKKGISQSEAARRLNIVRSTYSNYEAGNREPDNDTLQMLANFYEVSNDYLLGVDAKGETQLDKDKKLALDLIMSITDPDKKKAAMEYLKYLAGEKR